MPTYDKGLVWLRRDLRLHDHHALHQALTSCRQVWCVFIFDRAILDALLARGLRADRRVAFIRDSLVEIDQALTALGSRLIVLHDYPETAIPRLASQLGVEAVFVNRDYEPTARQRDERVRVELERSDRTLHDFKDQVIFDGHEIVNATGRPYTVFTPYRNAWLGTLKRRLAAPWDCESCAAALAPVPKSLDQSIPTLDELGFLPVDLQALKVRAGMSGASQQLAHFQTMLGDYGTQRDFPALDATSRLSVHLRFGTLSIRALVRCALADLSGPGASGAEVWLSELVWRDFFFQILQHHPHVVGSAFKPEYDAIVWEGGPEADARFAAWCEGRTGYPLVDAAMRQLNQTGFMHNRLRMVTASFLVKDLGIDWRRGEQIFANRLLDFDLAANNGGWQWAASTGCDAQPYFRIFNPVTQSEKFDTEGRFIKRWLPELKLLTARDVHCPWRLPLLQQHALDLVVGRSFPAPIVDHDVARKQTLERYAVVKKARA